MPIHADGIGYSRWPDARAAIEAFALAPLATPVVSAHVMGGCPLGPDTTRAAVDITGRYHHLANLYVLDGSLFPTAIGANPQLSIYGIVARLTDDLAATLTRRAKNVTTIPIHRHMSARTIARPMAASRTPLAQSTGKDCD